jgi:hypothetical protein
MEIMKNKAYAFCVLVLFLICLAFCSKIETEYTKECIVKNVQADKILIEDKTGSLWEFEGTNFSTGDKVRVTFNNNHTDTIKDDKIKKIEKNT